MVKLFIVGITSAEHPKLPTCAIHARICAEMFSGCEVVALSDTPEDGWLDAREYMRHANFFDTIYRQKLGREPARMYQCVLRYFIIEEYCHKHNYTGPIISIDWDVLVFGNLLKHFQGLGCFECDLDSAYVRVNGLLQVPTIISHRDIVHLYINQMCGYVVTWPADQIFMCDTQHWIEVRRRNKLTDSLAISMWHTEGFFDDCMTLDSDLFEMDARGKKIHWRDCEPWFYLKTENRYIKAVAMHTFMGWRNNTEELMREAKIL